MYDISNSVSLIVEHEESNWFNETERLDCLNAI